MQRTIADRTERQPLVRILALATACVAIAGCSTAVHQAAEKMAEAALGSIGVNRPGTSASQTSLTIQMRMEAAPDLNAGDDGRGLATVIRLYHLRAEHVFMAMPYANYGNLEKEKQDMGDDLVGTRELVLSPGQTLEITEKLEGEARYFGVVALFRSPRAQHWRYAFAAPEVALRSRAWPACLRDVGNKRGTNRNFVGQCSLAGIDRL